MILTKSGKFSEKYDIIFNNLINLPYEKKLIFY